jgi:ABC-type multidrug transport system permease subunit
VNAVATIVKADLRSTLNSVFRVQSGRRLAFVVIAGSLGLPLLGIAFGLGAAVGVESSGRAASAALASLFVAGAVMTFVLGLSTVIASFFAQRELLLLAVAPVSPASIFLARLARSAVTNGAIGLLLLSMVAGYGVARQAGLAYVLLAPAMVLALVVMIAAFQVGLLSVVLRVVSTTRARDVANLVAALAGTGLYLTWFALLSGGSGTGLGRQLSAGIGPIGSLDERLYWLPATWPALALGEVAQGGVGSGLAWASATVALAALMLAAGYLTYRRACIAGIGAFSEAAGQGPRRWGRRAPDEAAAAGGVPRPASVTRALVRKDWLVLRRDTRRLARLLPALAMAFVYPFAVSKSSGAGILVALSVPAFSAFFLAQVIGGPSIPSEGRGIQLLFMSPLSASRLLRAKVLFAGPPVVALCLAAALPITALTGGTRVELGLVALLTVWYASGMAALAVCMGAIDPRFEAADPNRAIGLEGIVLGLVGEAGFSILTAGAVALVVLGLFFAPGRAVAVLGGALVLAAAGAALVAGFLVFAERRLRRWQPV